MCVVIHNNFIYAIDSSYTIVDKKKNEMKKEEEEK